MSIFQIFIFFKSLELFQSTFILKFTKFLSIKEESNNLSLEEFINQRINNIYTTEIYIGDPPQLIPGFLKNHEYKFFLSNNYCHKKEYYHKEKSITFSYESSSNNYLGIKIIDSLMFNLDNNDIKIENFTIIVDNDMKSPQCFHIGTQLLIKSDEKDTNLLDILHKKKIIKSYFYKYKIINEDELYLICNLDIDTNNNNFKFIKPLIMRFFPNSRIYHKWGLSFEYFKLNNYKYEYDEYIKAEFDINYGCLLGTSEFQENFEKYLKDNEIEIEEEYSERENYIFYFEKNTKGIDKLKNFELIFYHRELDFNFTFYFEDLFLEKNNKFYFLVIFDYKTRNEWKFGFPFFKKYNFVFNHDSKIMGFNYKNNNLDDNIDYTRNEQNNKNKLNKNKSNNKINSKIILIIIFGLITLIIVILFFGIFIGKKLFSIRKTKVNELLELYDYSVKNNEIQNRNN